MFGESYTAYIASVVAGRDSSLFGSAGYARLVSDHYDDAEDRVFTEAGYQLPLGTRAQLCPLVGGSLGRGPDDGGVSVRSRFGWAGVAAGVPVGSSRLRVIPNGSVRYEYASARIQDPNAPTRTYSDHFGTIELGIGFILFENRLSILPTVQLPFAADDDSAAFGLSVSLGFAIPR